MKPVVRAERVEAFQTDPDIKVCPSTLIPEREFFTDNLLVRVHFIIVMIRWTGLAPWEFEFPFPGSLTSTFLMNPRYTLDFCRNA